MSSNRSIKHLWLSNLRAVATITVIMLHVAAPILYKFNEISLTEWSIGNIYDSITRFCVPIFFMISGSLLLSKDYELKEFFSKRFMKLIPPFIFWSIIYIAYGIVNSGIKLHYFTDGCKYVLNKLFTGSEYHLWFVYTIIGLYLFVPILRKWVKHSKKNEILYFLIIWGITIIYAIPFLGKNLPQIYLTNFSGYLGYMVLGYYLSNMAPVHKYKALLMFFFGIIVTIVGTYYLTTKDNTFNVYFYGYLTPNVLISSIGAFLIFKELNIKSKFINTAFSKINRDSYGIYLIHVLVLNVLLNVGLSWDFINPIISIPVLTILTLLISILMIHYLKKVKLISNLIG